MQKRYPGFHFKRAFSTTLLLSSFTFTTFAQDQPKSQSDQASHSKFFKGIGFGFLSQYESGPATITTSLQYNTNTSATATTVNNSVTLHAMTIYSCSYLLRYNIVEPNNNMAISLAAYPSAALSIGWATSDVSSQDYTASTADPTPGFLSIEIPLFAEFSVGNVSTFNADKNHGFMAGIGYEMVVAPLFAPASIPVPQTTNSGYYYGSQSYTPPVLKTNSFWTEPAVEVGYRYWSKLNKAMEFNLKYGFGTPITYVDATGVTQTSNPWTIKLSWIIYVNY